MSVIPPQLAPAVSPTRDPLPWSRAVAGALLAVAVVSGSLIGLLVEPDGTSIVVAAAIALAVLVGLLLRPVPTLAVLMGFWAPLVFVMMDTQVGTVSGVELNMTRFLGGVMVVSLLARMALRLAESRPIPKFPAPLKFYAVFAALVFVAQLRTPGMSYSFGDFIRFAAGFLLLTTLWMEIRNSSEIARIHKWTLAGIVASALLTITLWFAGPESLIFRMTGIERAVGTFGHSNVSGPLGVVGLALLFPFLGRCRQGVKRQLWMFGVLCMVGMIVTTLSRTAMVAMIVFLASWALLDRERFVSTRSKVFIALAAIVALVVGLALMGRETVSARVQDIGGLGGSSSTEEQVGSGRIGIWKHHWNEYTAGTPLEIVVGRGLGSSMQVAEKMYTKVDLQYGRVQGVHNEYLWLLMETGIVGLVVYLAFVVSLIRFSLGRFGPNVDATDAAKAFGSSFLSYFLSYQLANAVFGWAITGMGVRWYFLCFMGLAFAVSRFGADYLGAEGVRSGVPDAGATDLSQ